MKSIFRKISLPVILMVALVLGGIGSAVVLASVPDSNGVIHACYRSTGALANGQVRIIDNATQTCNSSETAITWNQTGPQGPPGPRGNAAYYGRINDIGVGATYASLTTGKIGSTSLQSSELLSSPNDEITLENFTAKLFVVDPTNPTTGSSVPFSPGVGESVSLYLVIDGTEHLLCTISDLANNCTEDVNLTIPPSSLIALKAFRTPFEFNGINVLFYAEVE